MKIFLIGLPGSGKTSLGKELARAMQLPFVDLDKEIEKEEGRSIKVIFKDLKEPYFRAVEARVLKHWCEEEYDFVMATGGGAACFFDNMQRMNNSGKTIFLDVPAREIARRMSLSKLEERPLLNSSGIDGVKDQIEFLRSGRISFYRQAHLTLTGESISTRQALDALKS
jgi:shikimate kinase